MRTDELEAGEEKLMAATWRGKRTGKPCVWVGEGVRPHHMWGRHRCGYTLSNIPLVCALVRHHQTAQERVTQQK